MKLPVQATPVTREHNRYRVERTVTPSGCCVQVCTPLGCVCAFEAPFC